MENNITNETITDYVSRMVDELDKIIQYLEAFQEKIREKEIARQKLEEAVFWLTYGTEGANDNR